MLRQDCICRHIFGLRGDVKDNIHFVEENTIIYPVGHTVVSYNVETKVQRFTPGSPESEGITALAVSPNKKFLAIAERADKGTISVYDLQTLKRRKVLVSSETGAKVTHTCIMHQRTLHSSMPTFVGFSPQSAGRSSQP